MLGSTNGEDSMLRSMDLPWEGDTKQQGAAGSFGPKDMGWARAGARVPDCLTPERGTGE